MTKLIFVRHGETNYNLQKLCNSEGSEVFLTDLGISQAKELKSKLKQEKIDFVIVSPTFRTRETFKYIELDSNIPYKEDSRITELKTNYSGKPISEYMSLINDPISGKLDGGESVDEMLSRINNFLKEIKSSHKNSTILVVSHSLVMKGIKVIIEKLPSTEINNIPLPKNGEIFIINLD